MDEASLGHDLPQLNGVVSEMTAKTKQVREHVDKLRHHILNEEHNPESGISLLELKLQLLMSYLVNLVQVVHLKTKGHLISGSPPVHRLVEIRTVLERIRPLDQKLKYQVDKLIRTAATGMASANDPLRFKPNPSNLQSKLEDNDIADGESQTQETKIYVPPKALSVPFNEKSHKAKQWIKPRATLMEELKEEVLGMPREVKTSFVVGGSKKQKELVEQRELEQFYKILSFERFKLPKHNHCLACVEVVSHLNPKFEENHMMRMMRKRKSQDTGRSNQQEIDDLTDFSEFRTITQDAESDIGYSGKRAKRKNKSKIKKGYRRKR